MSNRFASLLLCVSALAPLGLLWSAASADDQILKGLEAAKENLTQSRYLLRYKYKPGEKIYYTIQHLVSVDTTIQGNNQKTKSRTTSTRSLSVEDVSDEGNIRFVHVVDHVDMWSEVGGRAAVHFDSDQADPPPPEYQQFAQNIGRPISVITINSAGIVVDRQDKIQHPDLGLSGITIPMPKDAVPIGHAWSRPLEVKVRLEDKRIKSVKTRELYRLEKVETGIATISVKTQILTPLDNPRVKVQIIQRISQGQIRFDIDQGRLVSKKLEFDEKVLGFNGPESNMKYLAQFTETLVNTPKTARK